jgi:hypothetical protein
LAPELNTPAWVNALAELEAAALAETTWKKYLSVLRTFEKFFKESLPSKTLDFSEKTFVAFAIWCKNAGLSAASSRSYISTLRTMAALLGFKTKKKNSKAVKIVLKGAENLQSLRKTVSNKADPFTFSVLKKFRKALKAKKWRKTSKVAIWGACCLGYFGAFRAGELLSKKETVFDKFSDLLWNDVTFFEDGAEISLKAPKISVPGGELVDVFAFPKSKFCPVHALQVLKASQLKAGIWDPELPVFRFGSGKNLTVFGLSRIIKKLLKRTSLRTKNLSARSLRSGLPSDMEGRPDLMQDEHIKNWGRWRSSSYQIYMKNDRVQRRWIFEKICTALK